LLDGDVAIPVAVAEATTGSLTSAKRLIEKPFGLGLHLFSGSYTL
jgi:hypothetical protein